MLKLSGLHQTARQRLERNLGDIWVKLQVNLPRVSSSHYRVPAFVSVPKLCQLLSKLQATPKWGDGAAPNHNSLRIILKY